MTAAAAADVRALPVGPVGAANASALPGPGHAVRLDGTSSNRNAAGGHRAGGERPRSSRAVDRAGRKNLAVGGLDAGPRAARPAPAAPARGERSLRPRLPGPPGRRWTVASPPSEKPAAGVGVPDSGATAAGDTAGLAYWPGTSGCFANSATGRLAAGRLRCNSALGAGSVGTAVHNPSTDNAAGETGNGSLDSTRTQTDTERSPRERPTPRVKPRSGGNDSSSRRLSWHSRARSQHNGGSGRQPGGALAPKRGGRTHRGP